MWLSIYQQILEQHPRWKSFYKEQSIDLSRVQTETDIQQLPVLKKANLPHLQGEQLPFAGFVDESRVARIFVSPGPIYDPQGDIEDYWRFAPLLRKLGVTEGDIVQNTFSYHLSPAAFMFDSAARSLGARVIPAGVGNSELQVEVMKDLQVTVYSGTPSFLLALLRLAEEKGYTIGEEINLRKAIFTAEKVTEEMEQFLTDREIQYIDAYGTADIGCIAYRLQGEESFTICEDILVQICDPVTGNEVVAGELGEVVISMASDVYPLLRFGTGDLSKWIDTNDGRRMAGMLGRVGESYKVKGMFVHAHQLQQAVQQLLPGHYYQGLIDHVAGQDQFILKVEVDREVSKAERGVLHGSSSKEDGVGEQMCKERDSVDQKIRDWEGKLQEKLRVKPTIELVEKGSLTREGKQLIDLRGRSM